MLFRPQSVVEEEIAEAEREKERLRLEIRVDHKVHRREWQGPLAGREEEGLGKKTFKRYHQIGVEIGALKEELEACCPCWTAATWEATWEAIWAVMCLGQTGRHKYPTLFSTAGTSLRAASLDLEF